MQKFRTCFLILGVLLFCATAFGQGSPFVYVSGGPSSTIYTAAPPSVAMPTFTDGSNSIEGMVLGPDKNLYACEPTIGRIVRFDTTAESPSAVLVYSKPGPGLLKPQCGHFTSDGALLVSDETAGSGVWEFPGMAGSANPTSITPINLALGLGSNFTGAGLTQLKNGDLVFADQADGGGELWLAPFSSTAPHFSTARVIATGLTQATGVARNSASDIFVSLASSISPQIMRLHSTSGSFASSTEFTSSSSTTCGLFTSDIPMFMQFSAGDTLYVASQTATVDLFDNPGKVWSIAVSSASCSSQAQLATLPRWDSDNDPGSEAGGVLDSDDAYAQGIGIALPPTSVTNSPVPGTPAGTILFDFGFSAFEATNISPQASCTTFTLTETQVFPANMQTDAQVSDLGPFPAGVTEAEPLYGEGGFNNVFTVIYGPSCIQGSVGANILIGGFSNLTNPRVIQCDTGRCQVDPSAGAYPLGSLIPGDSVTGGHATPLSSFYLTNVPISTSSSGSTQAGYVCGLFLYRNLLLWDPAGIADADDLMAITFRLTNIPATGPLCSGKGVNGISNAQVAATLAEISPSFSLITLPNKANPGSPPLFTSLAPLLPGWYTYVLNLKGFAVGQYDFSAIFNTNNAPIQSATIQVVPGK